MLVEELYYKLETLMRDGYGSHNINMLVPDDTGFEEGSMASYNIDKIDTGDYCTVSLVSKR
jgi:hypothetical protein